MAIAPFIAVMVILGLGFLEFVNLLFPHEKPNLNKDEDLKIDKEARNV